MLTTQLTPPPIIQLRLLLLLLLQLPFYGPLSCTTRNSRYQKKHSPTYTSPDHQSSFICILHILQLMIFSLFNLHAWHSFCTISVQVFFGLPLGIAPCTSYTIHFFTQSLSSFRSTCNLFCCSTEIISSNPRLSLNLCNLMQPLQIKDFITLYMLHYIPLHFLFTHFWQLVHCIEHLYRIHHMAILQPSALPSAVLH